MNTANVAVSLDAVLVLGISQTAVAEPPLTHSSTYGKLVDGIPGDDTPVVDVSVCAVATGAEAPSTTVSPPEINSARVVVTLLPMAAPVTAETFPTVVLLPPVTFVKDTNTRTPLGMLLKTAFRRVPKSARP